MVTRLAMVVLIFLAAGPACAESLTPDAARRFVAGKLFAFNCFDGSRGAGHIYGDGSVIGTIQFRGMGPARTVSLPPGTLRVRGEAVCASLRGMAFEPCFYLEKTTERSFRGSWMGFAYCDFTQRMSVAGMSPRRHSSEPLSLEAAAEPAGRNWSFAIASTPNVSVRAKEFRRWIDENSTL